MSGMQALDKFYNGRIFVIPQQQRPYSWKKRQVEDLLLDIYTANHRRKSHYTGPIFLESQMNSKDKEKKTEDYMGSVLLHKYILDGQQRVTTLMLIASVLAKSKHVANNPVLLDNLRKLVSYKSDGQSVPQPEYDRPRLVFADKGMNELLIHLLFGGTKPNITTAGMQRLSENHAFITKNLETICHINGDGTKYERIANLFLEKIKLQIVDMEEDFNKYTVFESINNRGLGLSTFDKVKNLFLHIAESHTTRIAILNEQIDNLRAKSVPAEDIAKQLEIKKSEIVSGNPLLPKITKQLVTDAWYNSISCLHDYQINDEEQVLADLWSVFTNSRGQNDTFKKIDKKYKKLVDEDNGPLMGSLVSFINHWEGYFTAYSTIYCPKTHKKRFDSADKMGKRNLTRILDYLQLKAVLRLPLTTAMYMYDDSEFGDLSSYFEKWVFRVFALKMQKKKDAYSLTQIKFANKILNGSSVTQSKQEICLEVTKSAPMKNVINKFLEGNPIYGTSEWTGPGNRALYYFLYRVDSSLASKQPLNFETEDSTQDEQIEHILPQKHRKHWSSVTDWMNEDTTNIWVHRIGNLTLTTDNDSNVKLLNYGIERKAKTGPKYTYENGRRIETTVFEIAKFRHSQDQKEPEYNWQMYEIQMNEIFYAHKLVELWVLPCTCDLETFTPHIKAPTKLLEQRHNEDDFGFTMEKAQKIKVNTSGEWSPATIAEFKKDTDIHSCTDELSPSLAEQE